jgi:hypothetical protein
MPGGSCLLIARRLCVVRRLLRSACPSLLSARVPARAADESDTLSYKGLVLHSMGRKREGEELARRALSLDLRSRLCWHVLGLIQRADRAYDKAA